MKKRADIHINTIVSIILALLVLIVVWLIFSGVGGKFFSSMKDFVFGITQSFKDLGINETLK